MIGLITKWFSRNDPTITYGNNPIPVPHKGKMIGMYDWMGVSFIVRDRVRKFNVGMEFWDIRRKSIDDDDGEANAKYGFFGCSPIVLRERPAKGDDSLPISGEDQMPLMSVVAKAVVKKLGPDHLRRIALLREQSDEMVLIYMKTDPDKWPDGSHSLEAFYQPD